MTGPFLMERELGVDLLGPEGAGIFFFIEELDPADTDPVIVEVELLGIIHRMTELDFLADIGGRHFIESALEADSGVIIDHPLVTDEEDLIQFGLGEPADLYPRDRGLVAVHRAFSDAAMKFVVVILLEPEPEGLVEFGQADAFLDTGQEAVPHGSKKSFYFSTGGTVVGFGVDQGDAGQGAAFGQQVRGKGGAVI